MKYKAVVFSPNPAPLLSQDVHPQEELEGKCFLGRDIGRKNACFDGAQTRRRAILSYLQTEHDLNCLVLKDYGGVKALVRSLQEILAFAQEGQCDRFLLFYPDFPGFHPPAIGKLVFLHWFLRRMKVIAQEKGMELFLDIVDLPVFQSVDLGYKPRLHPWLLRRAEASLFSLFHRILLPSPWFAKVLQSDYGVDNSLCQVLYNGLHSKTVRTAEMEPFPARSECVAEGALDGDRREDECRFFYSGSLEERYTRGIPRFIEDYIAQYRKGNRLILSGSGGEWLFDERYVRLGVEYVGNLGEIDCLRLAKTADIGLIPYPEKPYFRHCFPSKLGFYAGAGIPVVTTALDQSMEFISSHHYGEVVSLSRFGTVFSNARELVEKCRAKKRAVSHPWVWDEMAAGVFDS